MRLMTSWAVVCDVWYLEPQTLHPGETHIEFAERWDSSNKSFQFQTFRIHIHSAVFAVAGCSLPLPHRDSEKKSFFLAY
jgi:hypothetical protein